MHTVVEGKERAHFNPDLSGNVIFCIPSSGGYFSEFEISGELIKKLIAESDIPEG